MPGKLIVDEIEDSGGTSVIGRKNYIINGNFDIWQRGTSLSGVTTAQYLSDRWRVWGGSGSTYSASQTSFTAGQTDVPNNPKYYLDYDKTISAGQANFLQQPIEDVYTLAGETITISFYAKHTTNAATDFKVIMQQNFGSGGSTQVNTSFATGQTTTTSWQKYTITGTVPSISGKTVGSGSNLLLIFQNSNNEIFDFQIAQVQVEKGSVATDFEVRPIGEELNLCERYYQRWEKGSDGAYEFVSAGGWSGTSIETSLQLKNTMRAKPTISHTGTIRGVYIGTGGSSGTTINANHITTNNVSLIATSQSTTGTAGRAGLIFYGVDSNSYLEADAEL